MKVPWLGNGWDTTCAQCGKPMRAVSHKQNVCSTECRFSFYEGSGDSCWEWKGPKNKSQGYGVLFLNQNKENGRRMVMSAHRYAYIKYFGEIPEEKCVMHSCDNPCCTNPAHLKIGTWADNNADRSAKGRSGSRVYTQEQKSQYHERFHGQNNPISKLTDATARAVKYAHPDLTGRAVVALYGISKVTANNVRAGRSWQHV